MGNTLPSFFLPAIRIGKRELKDAWINNEKLLQQTGPQSNSLEKNLFTFAAS
jgi:hypothetical protein